MDNLDRINHMTEGLKLLRNKMANLADLMYSESDFDKTDAFLQAALSRNLDAAERRRATTLLLANRHNRLTYRATVTNRASSTAPIDEQKRDTRALADFRRQYRLDLNMHWELLFWLENAYEDNAGFERLFGTESNAMRKERLTADAKLQAGRSTDEKPLR
jgi:hypothetical protein